MLSKCNEVYRHAQGNTKLFDIVNCTIVGLPIKYNVFQLRKSNQSLLN